MNGTFEQAELIRFYGSIVSTPGITDEIKAICNENILKLVQSVQSAVDKVTAKSAGLIV